nr:transposase [Variovorax sp. dw_308]
MCDDEPGNWSTGQGRALAVGLLARNPDNIARDEDRVRLRELLDANRALLTVCVKKDDLKTLWGYRHSGYAEQWKDWYARAVRSRIEPLRAFARNLKGYLSGILSLCRWPLSTKLVEGINNIINVNKRAAQGNRDDDDDDFCLKIRAAFPRNR